MSWILGSWILGRFALGRVCFQHIEGRFLRSELGLGRRSGFDGNAVLAFGSGLLDQVAGAGGNLGIVAGFEAVE